MAEVFGIVAGAMSIAALFNKCVDCFEFVQLSRSFERDYEICQLRLEITRVRLGRWGEAVTINHDPRFRASSPAEKPLKLTKSILEGIADLFESAKKTAERYELIADQKDLSVFEEKDMKPIDRSLHTKLRNLTRSRYERTSLARQTAWVLYDKKALEDVIDRIVGLLNELEKVFPVETVCQRLARVEVEAVDDEASLARLQRVAQGVDAVLSDLVAKKVKEIVKSNSAKNINTKDKARVQVGNTYAEVALSYTIRVNDQANNSAEIVSASGESGVHIGNSYGAGDFWSR